MVTDGDARVEGQTKAMAGNQGAAKGNDGKLQTVNRLGLDMFKDLFRDRKAKKLGPYWHLWHGFLALIPPTAVFLLAQWAKQDAKTRKGLLDASKAKKELFDASKDQNQNA